jgi:hypothetical protein
MCRYRLTVTEMTAPHRAVHIGPGRPQHLREGLQNFYLTPLPRAVASFFTRRARPRCGSMQKTSTPSLTYT